jgi:hypothetical protein
MNKIYFEATNGCYIVVKEYDSVMSSKIIDLKEFTKENYRSNALINNDNKTSTPSYINANKSSVINEYL